MCILNNWYVYHHIRKDTGEVFYVGIGCKQDFKRAKSKHNRNKFWKNITNKVEWGYEILHNNLDKKTACRIEQQLIQEYGRRCNGSGTLCNITEGGEGAPGATHVVSEEARKRIGLAQRCKLVSTKTREKLRNANKGKTLTEHTKEKIRIANSGKNHPNFGKKLKQETRKKIGLANTGRAQTEMEKRKRSESLKKIGMSLKSTQSKAVDIFKLNGDYVGRFHSISEASRQLNIPSNSNLRLAASGKRNRKQAYGYIIKYVNSGD